MTLNVLACAILRKDDLRLLADRGQFEYDDSYSHVLSF